MFQHLRLATSPQFAQFNQFLLDRGEGVLRGHRRRPAVGDRVEYDGVQFQVATLRGNGVGTTIAWIPDPSPDEQAEAYLEQLHLHHKVKVKNGSLSTTAVSQGQRKRLALLTAYLEDRPFYLFDEWASDQDPHFKKVFYTQLLPELKARGKTVLVITHDDKYFHLADRFIKLDYGKIEHGNTEQWKVIAGRLRSLTTVETVQLLDDPK